MKVLINKEVFGFVCGFLVRLEFDFGVVKLMKFLILVGFNDIGYDKGFDELDFGFCLILLGILRYRQGKILKKVC